MSTTQQAPRDGSVMIAGVPWLARMIDKARLEAAGTIDEFDLEFPCPMDQRCLGQLGVDAKTFQTVVTTRQSDDDVISTLREHGAKL